MNERAHRDTEKLTCLVCEKQFERETTDCSTHEHKAEPTVNQSFHWGLCPEHEALYESGVVFLIEVDFRPAGVPRGLLEFPDLDKMVRTGRVELLSHDEFRRILNLPLEELPPCVFIPKDMVDAASRHTGRTH